MRRAFSLSLSLVYTRSRTHTHVGREVCLWVSGTLGGSSARLLRTYVRAQNHALRIVTRDYARARERERAHCSLNLPASEVYTHVCVCVCAPHFPASSRRLARCTHANDQRDVCIRVLVIEECRSKLGRPRASCFV